MKKLLSTSFALAATFFSLSISAATCGTANTVVGSGETCTDIPMYEGPGISINNAGEITSSSNSAAILNNGIIERLVNSGTIIGTGSGDHKGIHLFGSSRITLLENSGGILGTGSTHGIVLDSASSITTLTNTGYIQSGADGVAAIFSYFEGIITTLNNAQGGNGSNAYTTALTMSTMSPSLFAGLIPTNYNIIINSPTHYGQFSVLNAYGSTTFGISSLTGTNIGAAGTLYQNVISGLDASFITNEATTLTYTNGQVSATYQLLPDDGSVAGTWDLSILSFTSGPSLGNTQSSLARQASSLRGVHNIASFISIYPISNTYDCNLFDVKGMCISAGGRYSTVDSPSSNSSAAVVTLGYKVNSNIRIGGFLDQSVNNNAPTGINLSNKNPMMGVFAYWNQNADGLGYQVKIANAYQDKDLTTTRDVIGTSEAGTGKTSLNARSYVGELSYAFMYKENTLVRPYFALRHTSIEQDAYTETGVATPLTYSALNDRTTSALMGVKFKHALTPKANLIGSLGIEQDLHNKTDQLTASGIAGLTSENLSGDLHRTRPVASIGATYDIAKTQRLSGEVLVQQLPFQSSAGATAYFNYMIGF